MSEVVEVLPLGEVVKPNRPRVKPQVMPDAPFIGMEHVEAHTMKLLGTVPAASMKSSAVHFKPGDVLYGRLRPYLNKVYRPQFEGLCSAEFIVFPENERIDGAYLQYFLNSGAFVRFASHLNAGDRPRVDFDQLSPYKIPLPAVPQQREIVAEIEKQFSRLDEAVASLQRVKANLKRYKAAILKAAVEGRLVETEAELARREGRSYETGEQLLQRILEERRARWTGKGKYKEPVRAEFDVDSLPPDGWAHVSWETVLAPTDGAFKRGPFGSALTKAIFVSSGYKVYEQYCPINDDCSFVRYYITSEKFEELKGFAVQAGDYLVSCSGSLGRITRVPEKSEPGVINQALLRVRLNSSVIDHRYFLHLFRGPIFQGQILEQSAGAAIPNVRGVNELKAMPIPLPPLAEQQRIADEVDRHLSIIHEVEADVDANLQRAQVLRQATLSKMFGGVHV